MHRILVVDDDPLVSNLVARMLTTMGYEVETAGNGAEALEVVDGDGNAPEVILSDMNMPVMDGEALYRALRARGCEAAFVGMSGNRDMLLACGLDAGLTKPFRMEDLIRTVEEALSRQPVG